MADEETSNNEKFSTFLNERSREIEHSITNYLKKQFKVTVFSTVFAQEIDIKEIFEENKLLRETIEKLKSAFSIMIKLIDEKSEIQLPFSAYETFTSIVNTEIDDFASLDILIVKKTDFDANQF
jgi:DNA-binding PucR family transcriptional regulator